MTPQTPTRRRYRWLEPLALAAGLLAAAPSPAATLGEAQPIRLNASVTVTDPVVRLGDLFGGELVNPELTVGPAPAPGQRVVLPADWLADLARSHGLDWRPAGPFDRAMVFRPGHTVPGADILAAVKAELIAQGMPRNFGVKPFAPLAPVVIDVNAGKTIAVREAIYDPASKTFSAVAEIAAGDPTAQFVPVRGTAMAVVAIPTLKQGLARNTVITADMIETLEVPETEIAADTVMDAGALIGKAPRGYIKSGQAIRQGEIVPLTLAEIPVLRAELRRGGEITAADIEWLAVNAAELPGDAVTDADYLIGKAPKRLIPARSAIRRGDVQNVSIVSVPVAVRDIRRGTTLSEADIAWVEMAESDVVGQVARRAEELVGFIANAGVRAGQPFRSAGLMRPVVLSKGKLITVIYSTRSMNLTAKGKALEDGARGQTVRVANTKSNTVVLAEVLDAETVRVVDQQTAMN